mgnify:CR=1 FL=1
MISKELLSEVMNIKIEDIINGEVKSKYEEPLDFSPKTLEETLFSVIK